MATITELEHLAAMANALRPDWPIRSLLTHLTANHGTRSYRDLAIALAWIATDPDTQTPARLLEQGPWWTLTRPVDGSRGGPRHRLCPRCRDPHDPAVPCSSQPREVIVRDSPDRLAAKAAARLALHREDAIEGDTP